MYNESAMQFAWKAGILVAVIGLLGWGVSDIVLRGRELQQEESKLSERLESIEEENALLAAEIEYYRNPENLIKELKSQFNYREGGEKLIIIVPESTSTRK